MATQVNTFTTKISGAFHYHTLNVTLITSGTTVTFTLPNAYWPLVHQVLFLNRTTGAINPIGGTYTPSTGVWVSPTMAVNDVAEATFVAD